MMQNLIFILMGNYSMIYVKEPYFSVKYFNKQKEADILLRHE